MEEDTKICRMIEANLHDFYFRIAGISGLDYSRDSGPMFIRNKPGKWPAFILGDAVQPEQEEFIKKITAGIKSGEYPPFWITREPAEPEELIDRLGRSGIRVVNRWTGMSLSVKDFIDDPVNLPGLEIQKLKKEDIAGWAALVNKEVFRRDALTTDLVSLMQQDPAFSFYSGFKGNMLVSTLLVFIARRITGLYLFSTDSGHRRQGIGKAVMIHAIKDIFNLGIDTIVLHGTRDGENIYKKLGFRTYCHFDILWYF
jgi:GNAT superfamily N-acetyltransferase